MAGSDESDDLKTRVAWLYHVEGMTQDEVAQEVGLTRVRVLRMLAGARKDGTVQVRVTTQLTNCVALARRLERVWNLNQAIVVPTPKDQLKIPEIIGHELGILLSGRLQPDIRLGLGWGKTLTWGVNSLGPVQLEGAKVISLLGGLTKVSRVNPSEFAWRVADKLSAECYLLAAPVFAPDPAVRESLLRHSGISEVLERARMLDIAIVSVGDLSPNSIFVDYGLLSSEEIASLQRAGAVGDILCHFIDAEGNLVDHPVNRRVLAVHPHDLRKAREIVLASGGWEKVTVMTAALKLLRPQVLITDEAVAEQLCLNGEVDEDLKAKTDAAV